MDMVQNSTPHDSTGFEPHEVTMGFPMPVHFDWNRRTDLTQNLTPRERLSREEAQRTFLKLKQFWDSARETILKSQEKQALQANRHRREPDFGPGDRVFVVKKTWSTDRPSDKLDFPLTRQHYEIEAMVGHSYKLKLPDGWRASRVFHADRLRKFPNNPLPGQANENPGPEELDGGDEWEVDRILTSREHYGKLQYQVQWRGWDPDPTWYDASGFKNATAKLRDFHERNPDKPGPPKRIDMWERAALEDMFDEDHEEDNAPATRKASALRRSTRLRGK